MTFYSCFLVPLSNSLQEEKEMLKRPGANFKLEFLGLFSKLGAAKELICVLAFPLYILHWCYTYTMCRVVKLPTKPSVSHMLHLRFNYRFTD